jgi:hypothetical protein
MILRKNFTWAVTRGRNRKHSGRFCRGEWPISASTAGFVAPDRNIFGITSCDLSAEEGPARLAPLLSALALFVQFASKGAS